LLAGGDEEQLWKMHRTPRTNSSVFPPQLFKSRWEPLHPKVKITLFFSTLLSFSGLFFSVSASLAENKEKKQSAFHSPLHFVSEETLCSLVSSYLLSDLAKIVVAYTGLLFSPLLSSCVSSFFVAANDNSFLCFVFLVSL
jgi:hypothetical protein